MITPAPGSADIHTAGFIQYALDRLGIKSPRALCGTSLAVPPGSDPAPLRDCPVCQVLASRRVRLPAVIRWDLDGPGVCQ
jgi:hypothetical protein